MKLAAVAMLSGAFAAGLFAQQFKLDVDRLSAKASDAVDVSLAGPLLQLGARFLDSKDPDQAAVKKLVAGLEGIYVRHFEFKEDGVWTQADLDAIRGQLKTPDWQRLLGWKDESGGNAEVYLRLDGGKMTGLAILDAEPREFTVVNIVGSIDLEALAQLGGRFGVPKLKNEDKPKHKDEKTKKK
ncbi:MAG TPA: DUF4252 domain-containing protein [Verrucomicrobiae bacterium]|nr:DUF4252 domain-containing protein [Verrucomicrobiae bacterium]